MFTLKNTTRLALLIAACASILSVNQSAFAGTVEAAVTVNPVGDFTAEFKDIDGYAYSDGDGFKADAFSIPWSKISTGMSVRDKHAKEYFNADKHPNIEVVSALGKGGKGVAKIKMNGEEQIVRGTYTKDGNNIVAEFPVILSKFKVTNVSFKGAGVQDEVKVKVTVPIKTKK